MHEIVATLGSLVIEQPTVFRNLAVFPLVGKVEQDPAYLTLDEALAAGQTRVTEVSEGGSVPELKFVNEGDKPVLLIDGEELVGAKQKAGPHTRPAQIAKPDCLQRKIRDY